MPYVAASRIKTALEQIPQYHPFFGVTLLSMLRSGVSTAPPIRWGSTEENTLLAQYYSPPGAPPRKPYFVPFGVAEKTYGYWRNAKYSAGSLQSARTRETFANALDHPDLRQWGFRANYLDVFEQMLPEVGGVRKRIPVLDFAAWLFRNRPLDGNLKDVVRLFRAEFRINDDIVFDRLFDGRIDESEANFFDDVEVDEDDLRFLTRAVPRGPSPGGHSEAEFLRLIEAYTANDARLDLPTGFVGNFYYSLKTQRFVVLAGRPGTGKTAFARAYAGALKRVLGDMVETIVVPIGQEQSESETIGYSKIAGGLEATELTRELFLLGRRSDVFIIVLDEMNLSQVDYYLARLLPAIESDALVELPGGGERVDLPPDAYFVGTINSFVEETTRVALSGPVKRRSNVIEMPNVLDEMARAADKGRFVRFCRTLLEQTAARIATRARERTASAFDAFREADVRAALGPESTVLASEILDLLWQITETCAADTLTSLTAGVLQDILDFIAMASGAAPLAALDRQVAQKLVPQLSGPAAVASAVRALLAARPDAATEFPHALAALDALLRTADPSSGYVFYKY
jgi:energy-coupling factor transporter ATP-binding protein EcfA2